MKKGVMVFLAVMALLLGMTGFADAYSTSYMVTLAPEGAWPFMLADPPYIDTVAGPPFYAYWPHQFTSDSDATHTMTATSSAFDPVLYLYRDSFSATSPTTNLLAYTTDAATGIEWDLENGTDYFLVTTTPAPMTSGQFTAYISESAAIPIPGAVWLLGSGLIALAGWRRKVKD